MKTIIAMFWYWHSLPPTALSNWPLVPSSNTLQDIIGSCTDVTIEVQSAHKSANTCAENRLGGGCACVCVCEVEWNSRLWKVALHRCSLVTHLLCTDASRECRTVEKCRPRITPEHRRVLRCVSRGTKCARTQECKQKHHKCRKSYWT